ncbi:MAG: hypothetical protein LBS68_00865 [Puniceicoccales bacterium]|nr:hypothetical protein [Puniceicoccales bacterium]
MNEEQKKQEPPPKSEILKDENPKVEILGERNPQVRPSIPRTNFEDEQPRVEASETPGPETSFEGEQPVIGTSVAKEILDDSGSLSEPHASGEESLQPPNRPIESKDLLQNTMVNQNFGTLEQGIKENAVVVKTQAVMDVNDLEIIRQLRAAQVLYFLRMEDNKFLFECARSTHYSEPKTRFLADNIEDVWKKSRNVKSLYFSGKLPENFQISGDKLRKLGEIIFSSDEIKSLALADHLTGKFEGLEHIAFEECINLQSARINGEWIAKKLKTVTFNGCPVVDDIHVGNHPNGEQIIRKIHLPKSGECFLGKTSRFIVYSNNCQKFSERQTDFNGIMMHVHGSYGCKTSLEAFTKSNESTSYSVVFRAFSQEESSISNTRKASTINLQLPGVISPNIMLSDVMNSHVIVNLNLAKYKRVTLTPNKTKIKHLEFIRPMDDCFVEFNADPGGTLLEINGFPKNSTGGTEKPFKMSFVNWSANNSELPVIKSNNIILTDIRWYKYTSEDGEHMNIPVIPKNCEKADRQKGWAVAEMPHMWNCGGIIELNSAFLFAEISVRE